MFQSPNTGYFNLTKLMETVKNIEDIVGYISKNQMQFDSLPLYLNQTYWEMALHDTITKLMNFSPEGASR